MQHAVVEDTYIPVSGHIYSRMRYLACMQHAVVEDTYTSIRTQILYDEVSGVHAACGSCRSALVV